MGVSDSPMKKIQKLLQEQQQQKLPPTVIDDEVTVSSQLSIADCITDNDQQDSVPSSNINNVNITELDDDAEKTLVPAEVDVSLLYQELGKLTESIKEVMHNTAAIPGMQTSIATLQVELKTQMTDLQSRVLINEEEILKLREEVSINSAYITQTIKPLVKQINRSKIFDTVIENSGRIMNLETLEDQNVTLKYELDEAEIESAIDSALSAKFQDIDQKIAEVSNADISTEFTRVQQETSSKLHKLSSDIENIVTLDAELLGRITALEKLSKSAKPPPPPCAKPPDKPTPTILEHDFVILGDSNTTTINMKEIAHEYKRRRFTCYTIPAAIDFVKSAVVNKQPRKVLLHVGTNDIVSADGNVDHLTRHYRTLFDETRKKFPNARIYVSSVFTRKSKTDKLNKPIKDVNSFLEDICDTTAKMTLIDNSNIGFQDMFDPKHIDNIGLEKFLWNIRHTVLGEVPQPHEVYGKDYSKRW